MIMDEIWTETIDYGYEQIQLNVCQLCKELSGHGVQLLVCKGDQIFEMYTSFYAPTRGTVVVIVKLHAFLPTDNIALDDTAYKAIFVSVTECTLH